MSETQPNQEPEEKISVLTEGEESNLQDIEDALPEMRLCLQTAKEKAESALQFVVYMGFKLTEVRKSMHSRGARRFDQFINERFELSRATIYKWIKISGHLAKYLQVGENEHGGIDLEWDPEMPEELRALSLRQAGALDAPDAPNKEKSQRHKKNLLETTVQFRSALTKSLEEKPIDSLDLEECYELVTSLDPIVETYNHARQRCMKDEHFAQALTVTSV